VSISAHSFGEALLLTARPTSPLERLSPRQLSIAREFGIGKSYKTIAKDRQVL
jgi:DNA-binding NarL/FixJ family response regulator